MQKGQKAMIVDSQPLFNLLIQILISKRDKWILFEHISQNDIFEITDYGCKIDFKNTFKEDEWNQSIEDYNNSRAILSLLNTDRTSLPYGLFKKSSDFADGSSLLISFAISCSWSYMIVRCYSIY
jgi:hypothetical protein